MFFTEFSLCNRDSASHPDQQLKLPHLMVKWRLCFEHTHSTVPRLYLLTISHALLFPDSMKMNHQLDILSMSLYAECIQLLGAYQLHVGVIMAHR